jgi:hypothetical protein
MIELPYGIADFRRIRQQSMVDGRSSCHRANLVARELFLESFM